MRAPLYALAFAAALVGSTASAQGPQGPGGPTAHPMMSERMMMGPMTGPGTMVMDPSQYIEGRLAFLKAELKITDAQTPQWTAFADAFRANAQRIEEQRNTMATMMGHESMSGDADTTVALPDRLDLMEKDLQAHLDMARAIKGPAIQLYAVLSNDQKHAADTLLYGPMGMM